MMHAHLVWYRYTISAPKGHVLAVQSKAVERYNSANLWPCPFDNLSWRERPETMNTKYIVIKESSLRPIIHVEWQIISSKILPLPLCTMFCLVVDKISDVRNLLPTYMVCPSSRIYIPGIQLQYSKNCPDQCMTELFQVYACAIHWCWTTWLAGES